MNDNDIKEKFEEIYHSKIEKIVGDLETLRLEKKKKYDFFQRLMWFFILCLLLSMVIAVVGGMIGLQKANGIIISFIISLFLTIVLGLYSSNIADKFRKSVKPPLLNPILSIFGKLKITNTEQISLKEIRQMGLYYQATNKKDDDIISGTYKDINMSITETELFHVESTGSGKDSDSKKVTDFCGLILKIKLNKDFESVTIVEQIENIENYVNMLKTNAQNNPELCPQGLLKALDNPILKTISKIQNSDKKFVIKDGRICVDIFNKNSKNKITKKLEKVTLEDPEFNKSYEVYSDDQVESRYWLTPSFMEKIKNIQNVFLVATTNFAFKEGYLYLYLDGCSKKNLIDVTEGYGFFEVGDINKTLLDKNVYLKLFRELITIFTLVNYLKQNESTKF